MAINIFTHIRRGLYDNVYNCILLYLYITYQVKDHRRSNYQD